jgi:thiol-disulfide isomerase/thioredoxin
VTRTLVPFPLVPALSAALALLASPPARSAEPVDEGPVEEVWGQVIKALESASTLNMTVSYSWQNRKDSVEPGRLEAVMARGNRFRVRALHQEQLLAEVACDGKQIVEWDHRSNRWTRYPLAEREAGSTSARLLIDHTGEIPVTSGFALLGSSWVTAPSAYEWHLQRLREADKVSVLKETVGARDCDTLVGKQTQHFGLIVVNCTVRLAFDASSHLPVSEKFEAKALIPFSTSPTWWYQFEKVEVDAPMDDQVFTLEPPDDANFVEPRKVGGGELVGQNIGRWEVKSLEGHAMRLLAPGSENPLILVVWASWCIPCKAELATLAKLRESGDLKNVAVLAVSIDRGKQQLQDFLARSPLAFPVARDPKLLERVGTPGVPTTIVLNRTGEVTAVWSGWNSDPNDPSSIEKLRQAVAEAAY